jgi:hypothetical protein
MEPRRRMMLYRTMHQWHWISAGVCLAALLLFSITGVTLNHASAISAKPVVTTGTAQLPQPLSGLVKADHPAAGLPGPIADWIAGQFGVDLRNASVEWSDEELYVSAPGPGRDAWISVDRETGAARYERTERGWMAYFNDLHKGRNTGLVWVIFIDVVAVACLFFSITGLILLQVQARHRRSTWPLVGGGVAIVIALMVFFAQ